jgi:hypothetical protein
MSGIMKAALVTWLLDHRCKLEKVEPPNAESDYWWIVFECPNKVGTTFKNFGSGPTECAALIDAMKRAGVYSLKARMFLLEFMAEHLANRAAPALLRRIENGSRA